MSNIKVVASVVNSSGILAEVRISANNDFIAAAAYDPTVASSSYVLMKADVFTPFSLFDTAGTADNTIFIISPVYFDLTVTSDSNIKVICPVISTPVTVSELFASTLVKNVDFNTATAQVDSEPVTISEIFVPVLNALDSNALNKYSFNSTGLN